ncbi:MATE family efflux transporter [Velocimicrobium porci]|uniref:MATE family efflux transporter n=1 Tax=Velocimicrobium porci TaxID=2606634 RepID=A0A6L5XV37_9FIRM|nr:MATE family efflux transporter [Velocimicrobium porci]MSS62700.1 MATE family efflux transporter [Velocimicrobium porci]
MSNQSTQTLTLTQEQNKAFYQKVFALVIPMALQNLINVGVTAADTIMLGKISETVLSGASLAGQIQFILTLIFFGLTSGASVLTAQYWGKRDTKKIEQILMLTIDVALIISLIFTLSALFIPGALMHIYTSDPAVIEAGIVYLRITSVSYLMMSITMVYLNVMKSVERVVISTIVYTLSLFINIGINAVLIFGLLGFPKLGIMGAAIGTLIARTFELVLVFIYAYKINKTIRIRIYHMFHIEKTLFKDFVVYSVPVLLNELLWGVGASANSAIIGHLSTSAAAANSVAQVCRQLATVVTFGVSGATAIFLGKTIGEHKFELAKIYSKKFIKLALLTGTIGGTLIFLSRPIVLSVMNFSAETANYLTVMLFVMFYFSIAQAFSCTLIVGIFRAGGDTKYGLFCDVGAMWGFSILFGFLAAFVFKWDIRLVYIILMSDEIIKIPIAVRRYKSMKWLKDVTR